MRLRPFTTTKKMELLRSTWPEERKQQVLEEIRQHTAAPLGQQRVRISNDAIKVMEAAGLQFRDSGGVGVAEARFILWGTP